MTSDVMDRGQVVADATEYRLQLGRELRRLRLAAGLTQAAAASRLPFEQPKLGKIETARTEVVRVEDLERMLDVYGATGDDKLRIRGLANQVRRGRIRSSFAPTLAFQQVIDAECHAETILAWHGERVPGQLQSEGYLFDQHAGISEAERTTLLKRRRARVRLYTVDEPPLYRVILSESSLYRLPGGYTPSKAVELVEHWLRLCAKHSHLELQILPFAANVPFVDADFVVLQFSKERRRKDFAYIEYPGDGRLAKRDSKILKACRDNWYEYHNAALSTHASHDFLLEFVERNSRRIAGLERMPSPARGRAG